MEIELLYTLGKIITAIGSIWGAIKYLPKWYRFIRSWTVVKREELDRLKKIEPKYEKCLAELKDLNEFCAPYREQIRAERVKRSGLREMDTHLANAIETQQSRRLDQALKPIDVEVDAEFDVYNPLKK